MEAEKQGNKIEIKHTKYNDLTVDGHWKNVIDSLMKMPENSIELPHRYKTKYITGTNG